MKLIFMGQSTLAEGFRLLGFETHADATSDQVNTLLADLLKNKEKALIFLDNLLAAQTTPMMQQVRTEAAGIILTELPPLNQPDAYQPAVDDLIKRVLGQQVLDN